MKNYNVLSPKTGGEENNEKRVCTDSRSGDHHNADGRLFCRGLRFDAVLGPEELFPSVSHEPFSVAPDCECAPVQPALRTARLYWQGRDLWFCVNEGAEAIETRLTLPTRSPLGAYDLWAGKARRIESRDCTEGKQITLRLERNESVLLFACKSAEEWAALPGRQPVSIRLKAEDFTAGKDGAGVRLATIMEKSFILVRILSAEMSPETTMAWAYGFVLTMSNIKRRVVSIATSVTGTFSNRKRVGLRFLPYASLSMVVA